MVFGLMNYHGLKVKVWCMSDNQFFLSEGQGLGFNLQSFSLIFEALDEKLIGKW